MIYVLLSFRHQGQHWLRLRGCSCSIRLLVVWLLRSNQSERVCRYFQKGRERFFALVCALALFCLEDRGLGNSKKGNIFQRSPFYFYFDSSMTGNNEISRQVYRESPRHIANDCGIGMIVYLCIIVDYLRLQHLWLYFGIFIIHFDP